MFREFNFDGLVGPTHNFGAAVLGNLASTANARVPANPRRAALEGLEKMRMLHQRGVAQAVLPPQMRPELDLARRLGFVGTDRALLGQLARRAPAVLAACYAASSMWTANAATVSPSPDTEDGCVHITPANLQSQIHRAIEWPTTQRILQNVFRGDRFVHHEPLPSSASLGDEGSANHMRLSTRHEAPGLEVFVYGESVLAPKARPVRFPARQTREASESVVRLHRLRDRHTLLVQQHPAAIDAGVFHNDVIAVGDLDLLICHEDAYVDTQGVIQQLRQRFEQEMDAALGVVVISREDVPLQDAVATYLFNSQLISTTERKRLWILPRQCAEHEAVHAQVERIAGDTAAIDEVLYIALDESMRGGGGPACLRLRVALDEAQADALPPGVLFDDALDDALVSWIERHYRDRLELADLADPRLLDECRVALDELTTLLGLPCLYPFQVDGERPGQR